MRLREISEGSGVIVAQPQQIFNRLRSIVGPRDRYGRQRRRGNFWKSVARKERPKQRPQQPQQP